MGMKNKNSNKKPKKDVFNNDSRLYSQPINANTKIPQSISKAAEVQDAYEKSKEGFKTSLEMERPIVILEYVGVPSILLFSIIIGYFIGRFKLGIFVLLIPM